MHIRRTPDSTQAPLAAWLLIAVIAAVGLTRLVPAIRFAVNDQTSDVLRQWRTSQYILARVNPYPVALEALETTYGSSAPERLRTLRIYAIPKQGPHPDTRKDVGPPESTYPPTAALILALAIGHVQPHALLLIWAVLNLGLFGLIGRELIQLQSVPSARTWSVICLLSLSLLWPPTIYFFSRGQFTLIVLWSVLVAERIGERRSWLTGILYSIALIKPSVALPFLLLPLRRGRWRSLIWTAAIQVALLASASLLLRASPAALLSKWLLVSRYFMQGMYTAQEIIIDMHLIGTIWNIIIPLTIAAIGFFLSYRAEANRALAIISVIAALWTYHYPYDFLVLLCALAFLLTPADRILKWDSWQWSGIFAFALLGVALTDVAVGGNTMTWRIVRWGGRLSSLWIIISTVRAKRSCAVPAAELPAASLSPIT